MRRDVKTSADGQFAAIAVNKLTGGFFDTEPNLKAVRVIVYQVSSGMKISDVQVKPPPLSQFGFALSPTGDILAIVSGNLLEIVTLKK